MEEKLQKCIYKYECVQRLILFSALQLYAKIFVKYLRTYY